MTKALTVTPASEWKRERNEGIAVELPSGKVVRLRSVSMQFMLRMRRLPDQLTNEALAAIGALPTDGKPKMSVNPADAAFDAVAALDKYHEALCRDAFVYPRIVDDPQKDDEISWEWVADSDKHFVDELLQIPMAEWQRFRQEPVHDVEPISTSKGRK